MGLSFLKTSMSRINYNDLLNATIRILGSPKNCIDSLTYDSILDEETKGELDKLVSLLIIETVKYSASGYSRLNHKLKHEFLLSASSTITLFTINYTELLNIATFIDSSNSFTKTESDFLKISLNLICRKEDLLASSMFSTYFLSTVN